MSTDLDARIAFESLIRRLLDHAQCHEHIAHQDTDQAQWALDLRNTVELLTRYRAALAVAADHLPYHEPEHPDYEGSTSDAGRMVRLAIDPLFGCSSA